MTTGADAVAQPIPFTGLRGAVARSMEHAWTIPSVSVAMEVRLDACMALRDERQSRASVRLSPTPFIMRAASLALRRHPSLNGTVSDSGVHLADRVNIGLATSVDGGLVVPVVRDVDLRPAEVIGEEAAELALAGRRGELKPRSMQGGTFTVSSLGATGARWFTPIINAPQIAILGVGAAAPTPMAQADGTITVATVVALTLSFDHRAVDGYPAALFLRTVRDLLEAPADL